MNKSIKVAIVGVGNCASSLIQGIGYYSSRSLNGKRRAGLIHNSICGYTIKDIEIVSAFDVNIKKIGRKISDAIFIEPNCTKIFYRNKLLFKSKVLPGPILDGITKRLSKLVNIHRIRKGMAEWQKLVVSELVGKKVDILISYLPVGSKEATRFYAKCALLARVGYINAIPEFICSTGKWDNFFNKAGIPCAGDDIKSQIGATILHRVLISLIDKRGGIIENTFQLNIGGNTDFLNMMDEDRLISKRMSKTEAVTEIVKRYKFDTKIGPSDFVPYLKDNKICFIEINGRQFGDIPFKLEARLSIEDSPNSAGVMVDVIRLIKVAMDKGLGGYQDFSSYYFKHPKKQFDENFCKNIVESFIKNNS